MRFMSTCTHTGCKATEVSLQLAHIFNATSQRGSCGVVWGRSITFT